MQKIFDLCNVADSIEILLDPKFESQTRKPTLNKQTIAKIIEIIENFELCDIWRIKDPNLKLFTFWHNHFSDYIQRRLSFFFILNTLRGATRSTHILAAFPNDCSPIFLVSQDLIF